MSFDLKIDFDLQSLTFDGVVDIRNGDIVAILSDPAGTEVLYTRDILLGEQALPAADLPENLREARQELYKTTRKTFGDLLLRHDKRWLHARELEPGLFSLSFNQKRSVPDNDATNFILSAHEITLILGMMGPRMDRMIETASPDIQAVMRSNRLVLQGTVNNEVRQHIAASGRISSKVLQRPQHELRSI